MSARIRRWIMRKLFVVVVALVSAAGGVSACGNNDKAKEKTPAADTAGVPAQTAAVNPFGASDASVVRGPQTGALETPAKTPKFTLVLGEGKGGFKFRSVMLSDEAKAKID